MALSSKIIGFMGKGRKRKMEKGKEKWKRKMERASDESYVACPSR